MGAPLQAQQRERGREEGSGGEGPNGGEGRERRGRPRRTGEGSGGEGSGGLGQKVGERSGGSRPAHPTPHTPAGLTRGSRLPPRADRAVPPQEDVRRVPDAPPSTRRAPQPAAALEAHGPRLLLVDGLLVGLQHLLQGQLPRLRPPGAPGPLRPGSVRAAPAGPGHGRPIIASCAPCPFP